MNRIKPILAFGLCSMAFNSFSMHTPSAVDDHILAIVGQPVTFSIQQILSNDSDLDGDELFITTLDDNEGVNGNVSIDREAGEITFTPISPAPTEGKFTYGIADEASNTDEYGRMGFAQVTISFSAAAPAGDTAPIAKNDSFITTSNEPFTISISDLLKNDYSLNNTPLYLVYVDDVINGQVIPNYTNGTLSITRTDLSADTTLNYGIAAAQGESNPELIGFASIKLSNTNNTPTGSEQDLGEGPAAHSESITRASAHNFIINTAELLENDSDPEGMPIYVTYVDDSRNGVAELNKDLGTIKFTFEQGQTTGKFTYGVSDSAFVNDFGRMGFAEATVVIDETYSPPEEQQPSLPTAVNDHFEGGEQSTVFTINFADLLENDINPNNAPMYIIDVDTARNGTIALQENSVSFSPDAGFTGTASFSYYLSYDASATKTNSSQTNVSISFSAPTPPPTQGSLPVAVNDQFIGTSNVDLVFNIAGDLLANDMDADSDQLYLVAVDDWENGIAEISEDGLTVTFKPNLGYVGPAVFYYQVSDIPNDTELTRISYGRVDLTIEALSNNIPGEGGEPPIEGGHERESNIACLAPTPSVDPEQSSFQQVFPNLHIATGENDFVLSMVQPQSNSNIWLASTRFGRIYQFANNATVSDATLVLDLSDKVITNGEFGLTSIAFHPNFPINNHLYVAFNDNLNGSNRSVIASYEVDPDTFEVNRASEKLIFNMVQPGIHHNGGDLVFGLDGYLYAGYGDSDYESMAQNVNSLLGAIIRIDVNQSPYGIPTDNPYYDESLPSCNGLNVEANHACPEIYAKGFRNPWRLSIDQLTGDLWVGDVGSNDPYPGEEGARPNGFEEANKISVSSTATERNFGWPLFEGDECRGTDCSSINHQAPIAQYAHAGFASVVGGYVYRGTQSPDLYGQYIFIDGYKNNVYMVAADASGTHNSEVQIDMNFGAFAMAQGNDGEVYFLNRSADAVGQNVQRIVASGGVSYNMPPLLSDTGCFDTLAKTSTSGSIDYKVNAALWSDGEEKSRSFAIPDGTQLDVLADGDYVFPVGSMLLKHFKVEDRYIETRILAHQQNGWAGYSYKWNEDGTDAELLTEGETISEGDFIHTFPSRNQCGACHTNTANMPLGPEHGQLNYFDEVLDENMITHLDNLGYFSEPQVAEEQLQLSSIEDDSASLEQRARSYLHANCAGCHSPQGSFTDIDLRYTTAFGDMNLCNVEPSKKGTDEIEGYMEGMQRLLPGEPNMSMLLFRMRALEPDLRMPRLGSLKEHTLATEVIADWITTMPGCN